ncbi:MAG TPA: hypothetical protein DIT91_04470 [Actinobacteria bacterium]|jgi:glycosyltransferase involved in cell wall biosynthesis|nr:hypothetical protein [Actinomycetota bacterium]
MQTQENLSIVLIYEGRLGSSRADSTFVLKNARCFSKISQTAIWVSKREGWNIPDSVLNEHEVLSLGKRFDPKTLVSSIFHQLLFGLAIRRNLSREPLGVKKTRVLIFHDWWPLIPLITLRKRKPIVVLEVHRSLPQLLVRLGAFSHINLLVATNKFKFKELLPSFEGKIIYERNAVDLSDYKLANFKAASSPKERISILYTGSLGVEKNPEILITISAQMPTVDFIVVGSSPRQFKKKDLPNNLILLGSKPHAQIPQFQVGADFLLITLNPSVAQSSIYTSTMKLFEYIAAKRPIIAPNLASVLEVLDLDEFYSYDADSVDSLKNAIHLAIKELAKPRLPRISHLDSISWEDRNNRIVSEFLRICNKY